MTEPSPASATCIIKRSNSVAGCLDELGANGPWLTWVAARACSAKPHTLTNTHLSCMCACAPTQGPGCPQATVKQTQRHEGLSKKEPTHCWDWKPGYMVCSQLRVPEEKNQGVSHTRAPHAVRYRRPGIIHLEALTFRVESDGQILQYLKSSTCGLLRCETPSSLRGSSWPRDQTWVCLHCRHFTIWATREALSFKAGKA